MNDITISTGCKHQDLKIGNKILTLNAVTDEVFDENNNFIGFANFSETEKTVHVSRPDLSLAQIHSKLSDLTSKGKWMEKEYRQLKLLQRHIIREVSSSK